MKKLTVAVKSPSKKSKSNVIDVSLTEAQSAKVQAFVDNKRQVDDLEKKMKDQEREIKQIASEKYFNHRITNIEPTSSVRLPGIDDDLTYSFQNKYSTVSEDAADALFEELEADADNYLLQTVKAKFDDKVFINGDGEFDEARYNAFKAAIDAVAAQFGIESPLDTEIVVSVKPDFHELRFKDFKSVDKQVALSRVIKNTQTLKIG